jgi:predicted NBD/HSP70 family sugar kinase
MALSGTVQPWVPLAGQAHRLAVEVLLHGPLSRAELARRTDLSAGSLTRLTKPLVEAGLLVEAGPGSGDLRPGRPSQPLDIVPDAHHFVGVKITGDAAHGVVTTLRADVVASAGRPLDGRTPAEVADVVAALVDELAARVPDVTAVGVSVGGHVLPDGTVQRAPFLGWADVPLTELLQERTTRPVVAANDVMALTEATHWFGEGRGHDQFALVTVGAGVGVGVVAHDRLLIGPNAGLGLLGHHVLDPLGPLCPLGHRGCATAMLTTGSIERQVAAARGDLLPYDEVLDLAGAGDELARHVVDDAGRALGRLVAVISNVALPEVVVLGGEGARLAVVARAALDAGLAGDIDPLAEPPALAVQVSGFDAWARGAAVIAIQTYVLGR